MHKQATERKYRLRKREMITQKTENPIIGAFKDNKDDEKGIFRIQIGRSDLNLMTSLDWK